MISSRSEHMEHLLERVSRVGDAATETFELFAARRQDGADLGMLAPRLSTLEVTIEGQDFIIAQSPGLLCSNNTQGTTGAAAWQSGVRFAAWIAQSANILFRNGILQQDSTVLELGAGVAGIVSLVLAARLGPNGRMIASDMDYATKLLRANILNNEQVRAGHSKRRKAQSSPVDVVAFDWEKDDAKYLLKSLDLANGVDMVVACDCVYNYALITPFLESVSAICALRRDTDHDIQTACIVVQQLRQPDVFEDWLDHALAIFNIWRLPPDIAGSELSEESGFSVHILMLR